MLLRRLRRRRLLRELAFLDQEVAQNYVDDGQLSLRPLSGPLSGRGWTLRDRRRELTQALRDAGGRDPWPTVLREPSAAQQQFHHEKRKLRL